MSSYLTERYTTVSCSHWLLLSMLWIYFDILRNRILVSWNACNFAEEPKWTVLIIKLCIQKTGKYFKYITQRDVGCQKQSWLEHFFHKGGISGLECRFIDVDGGNVKYNILQLQNKSFLVCDLPCDCHYGNKIIATHKCSNMSQVEN